MAVSPIILPWEVQPDVPARIDLSKEINRNIRFAELPFRWFYDALNGGPTKFSLGAGGASNETGYYGRALDFTIAYYSRTDILLPPPMSWLAVFNATTNSGSNNFIGGSGNAATTAERVQFDSYNGTIRAFFVNTANTAYGLASPPSVANDEPTIAVFTVGSDLIARLYHKNIKYTGATGSGSIGTYTQTRIGSTGFNSTGTFGKKIYFSAGWDRQLSDAEAFQLLSNPWSVFESRVLQFFVTSGGGNVTVALTGVSATGAVGNVTAAVDCALTGVSATGAVGNVTAAVDCALTGVSATGAVGTTTATITCALTGISATGATGTVSAGNDASQALTGVSATGDVGTTTATITCALTGVSATGATGAVSAGGDVSQALTGISATGAVGTTTATITCALTGVSATGTVGTTTATITRALTGNQVSGALGTLGVVSSSTVALTGVSATGQLGTLLAAVPGGVTVPLTGVSATGSVGSLYLQGVWVPVNDSNPNAWVPVNDSSPNIWTTI